MTTYRIQLFGKISIQRGDVTITNLPAKAQELLCYLLLHPNHPHTREFLAEALWVDAPAAQSKKYLRQSLWQLQGALELQESECDSVLLLEHDWIQVNPAAPLWLDTWQLEQAFALVRQLSGAALTSQQAQAANAAAQLYQGDLLTGWYQDWCLVERECLQSMFFVLLDKLMDYCVAHRRFDNGIEHGRRLLRYEYTREATHRRLMRLYFLADDRTGALRQFEQCASVLAREFHVAPTESTLALAAQIRAGQLDEERAIHDDPLATGAEAGLLQSVLAELRQLRTSLDALRSDVETLKQARHDY